MKASYSVDFKKLGAWLIVIFVVVGGLYILSTSESETEELNVEISEELDSGELTTVRATLNESPVSGAQVYLNGENVGATNQEGRLTVPITQESGTAEIRVKNGEKTAEASATVIDTSDNQESSNDDDSDSSDSDESDTDSSSNNEDNNDSSEGDNDNNDADEQNSDSDNQDSTDDSTDDSNNNDSNDNDSDNQDSEDDSQDTNDGTDNTTEESEPEINPDFSTTGQLVEGNEIIFDSSPTTLDNEISTVEWTIDGQTYTGPQISHTFQNSGRYTVSLEITDNEGNSNTTGQFIEIGTETNQEPYIDLELENGDTLEGPTHTFTPYIETPSPGWSYTIYVGGTDHHEASLSEGANNIEEEIQLQESGQGLEYYIEAQHDDHGTHTSNTTEIDVDRAWGEFIEINEVSPANGDKFYQDAIFEVDVSSSKSPFQTLLYVDGELESTSQYDGGFNDSTLNSFDPENYGQFDWYIVVRNQETNEEIQTEERSITIEPPLLEVDNIAPSDSNASDPVQFEYELSNIDETIVIETSIDATDNSAVIDTSEELTAQQSLNYSFEHTFDSTESEEKPLKMTVKSQETSKEEVYSYSFNYEAN